VDGLGVFNETADHWSEVERVQRGSFRDGFELEQAAKMYHGIQSG